MALVFTDLTKETTSTTGTGTLTLTGAVDKYQSFANIGTGNTTYYRIESGNDSEVGLGTYNGTLSRDTVYMSIIAGVAGTTKITVADGATVSCVYPAERAVYLSETGTLGIGGVASATAEVAITEVGLANSGSLAGSAVDIAQTWNTTGNPAAIKLNVTNTNSGSTSKLMDLQVGGTSVFRVMKDNKVRIGADNTNGVTLQSFDAGGTGKLVISDYTSSAYASCVANTFYGATTIGAGSAIFLGTSLSSPDTYLWRDAANTLAQRNSTNSQTSRIYNTYTDASNYERSALSFVTYSGALYTKLAAESAGTGAANIGIALSPKGTGAITAQVPDGTTVGGNARGANSVDLQQKRGLVANVASADYASIVGGQDNAATGVYSSVLGGYNNKATAYGAVAMCRATIADKPNQVAAGIAGQFFSQHCTLGLAGATTDAILTQIFLGHDTSNKTTIPNSTTWAADIDIVARSTSGTENAYFKRRLVIQKGTTAASTALIGTVQTVGTDIGTTNMLAIANPITLTADTTNGAMKLEVTGIAATNIRWVAKVSLVEVGYA